MKKDLLEKLKGDYTSCTLYISNKDMKSLEEIKFYKDDFEYKSRYIDSAYDDELLLKRNTDIKIVKIKFESHYTAYFYAH